MDKRLLPHGGKTFEENGDQFYWTFSSIKIGYRHTTPAEVPNITTGRPEIVLADVMIVDESEAGGSRIVKVKICPLDRRYKKNYLKDFQKN